MNITYQAPGAPAVVLQICHFVEFSQTPVYSTDRADRIGTHFVVEAVCVWNPRATASQGGQVAIPPPGVIGDGPALSLSILRDVLETPRGVLTVDVGGQVILSSPPTIGGVVQAADLDSGPRCLHCNVQAFWGIQSAIVRVRYETTISEAQAPFAPGKAVQVSALLSNRWSMEESIAMDYTSQLHIEGEAVFSAALTLADGVPPDSLRSLILPPVRAGFQRTALVVKLSSDSTRIVWRCDDEQVIYALAPNSGIVKIRGRRRVGTQWAPLSVLGAGEGPTLPQTVRTWSVEVWGRAATNQVQLANAVLNGLASAGAATVDSIAIDGWVEVGWPERYAAGGMSATWSGIVGAAQAIGAGVNLGPVVQQFFLANEVNANNGQWTTYPASQGAAAVAPGTDGRHGDALIRLVAQQLTSAGVRPPAAVTAV